MFVYITPSMWVMAGGSHVIVLAYSILLSLLKYRILFLFGSFLCLVLNISDVFFVERTIVI